MITNQKNSRIKNSILALAAFLLIAGAEFAAPSLSHALSSSPANYNMSASPAVITLGQSSVISASASLQNGGGGGACTYPTLGPLQPSPPYEGSDVSITVTPTAIGSYTYGVNCTTPSLWNPSATLYATLTVNPVPTVPSVTLTANPSSITSGGSSNLTLSTSNVTSCTTGTNNFDASGATSGNFSVSPGTTTTYSITCTGTGGSATGTATVTVTPPALSASCAVSPATSTTGTSVNWNASPVGGTGTYTYVWSGSDGLTGATATLPWTYSTTGTKTGQVVVTSGSQSVTVPCSNSLSVTTPVPTGVITVNPPTTPAPGDPVTITYACSNSTSASINNGVGPVTPASGGTVTVDPTSSTSYTLTCTGPGGTTTTPPAPVTVTPVSTLAATCSVSPGTTTTNQPVTWTASPSGGTAPYTYAWGGSVTGTTQSVSTSYATAGSYSGQVTVKSADGQSVTAQCSPSGGTGSPAPIVVESCSPSLSASKTTVVAGQSTDLTWSESGICASSCVFSDGHTAGLSGTYTVTPPTPPTGNTDTYSVTCGAPGNTSSTNITVNTAGVTISATPDRIKTGGSGVSVTWSSTNATACTVTGNGNTWTGLSGTQPDPNPLNTQTTYTATCTTAGSPVTNTSVVNVAPQFTNF